MAIFDTLKKLLSARRPETLEQVTERVPPLHPEQPTSGVATFSESEVSVAKKRAEALLASFNESLSAANQSKCRATRESRLQIAREQLNELKEIAREFPFLHLERVEAVEASIIAIDAETRLLPYPDLAESEVEVTHDTTQSAPAVLRRRVIAGSAKSAQERLRLSARDEQAMLLSVKSYIRVINKSIDIARKSKNLETTMSRLGVARNRLKEAQELAGRFSLEIEGFDRAEGEINRVEEAIRNGMPREVAGMQAIDVGAEFNSAARTLLKEATALKRERRYVEACEKLREAYAADGAENLMIEDRLRLPMYLQLAGNNDEGWDELNRLSARYVDEFSQPRIAHQMKIFLRKENNESASNPVRVVVRGNNGPRKLQSIGGGSAVGDIQNASSSVGRTIGELQAEPLSAWGNADFITGLEFNATMQLRTPLRTLLRHGETHIDRTKPPPQIALESWEGLWMPKTKTFRELGVDIDDPPPGRHASDIGSIVAADYLPFLIAVRKIVESYDTMERRIAKLRQMPVVAEWQEFLDKHGGIEGVVQYLFPRHIRPMPNITASTAHELLRLGLDTPDRIGSATDEELLGIKGIGPAKLQAIREHCADMAKDRDADRVENIIW